jgi:hypothetical protein
MTPDAGPPIPSPSVDAGDPCAIVGVTDMGDQGNVNMMDLSPDHSQVVVNKKDSAGVFQVFVGPDEKNLTCISCTQVPSGPSPSKNKVMTLFTKQPGWITLGVEMDAPNWPPLVCDQSCKDGLLISGINADLWAVKTDGSQWVLLKKWDPMQTQLGQGFTGPAFTPDGAHGYWAVIVDGDVLVYGFGKWRLMRSDFALDANGVLTMSNTTDITPEGANWMEPGNISPDGKKLLFNSDIGLPANQTFGQDQFVMDLDTGAVTNLTHSPSAWDEHGLFSPDGKKIVWMSSKPYPDATWVGNLRTDFMLMDADGSNVQQLTHFNQPGYPESLDAGTVAAVAGFTPDGRKLLATDQWAVGTQRLYQFDFNGACGLTP